MAALELRERFPEPHVTARLLEVFWWGADQRNDVGLHDLHAVSDAGYQYALDR